MLNLTRRSGEAIVIKVDGREIRVCVSKLSASRVILGIDAPPEVTILREEIKDDGRV